MPQNYYEILGVAQNATAEEIEAAFRKRAREVHPDTVAPGNAYLRQVAAEAFKDLSQAKGTLLNPFEREKYDAKLKYQSGSQSSSTPTSAAPPPKQPKQPGPQQPRSRRQRSQPSARPPAQRQPFRIVLKPLASSLESFSFVILGVVSIFFIGWLMASGRTPPWWAAGLTLALGVTSFRHGLTPGGPANVRGPLKPVLIVGFVAAIIFFAVWLPSAEVGVRRTSPGAGDSAAESSRQSKAAGPLSSQPKSLPTPSIVTMDELGHGTSNTANIWMDVRTGKNYRTRTTGDALVLEVVETAGKSAAGIVRCDFHRAGQEWTGNCSERTAADPGVHYTEGKVSTISRTRLEGYTSDIAEFLMVPVDNVSVGGQTDPSGNAVLPEPDLSGLSDDDKKSIEMTCASDKLLEGPIEYNHCVSKQLDALRDAPKPPDLSHLSARERDSLELVCSNSKLMEGPRAYNQCLIRQLELMKKPPR